MCFCKSDLGPRALCVFALICARASAFSSPLSSVQVLICHVVVVSNMCCLFLFPFLFWSRLLPTHIMNRCPLQHHPKNANIAPKDQSSRLGALSCQVLYIQNMIQNGKKICKKRRKKTLFLGPYPLNPSETKFADSLVPKGLQIRRVTRKKKINRKGKGISWSN